MPRQINNGVILSLYYILIYILLFSILNVSFISAISSNSIPVPGLDPETLSKVRAIIGDTHPNEILDPTSNQHLIRVNKNAKLYLYQATSTESELVSLPVLHLYGKNPYEMGYAYGQIYGFAIYDYMFNIMPAFYQIARLDQSIITPALPQQILHMLAHSKPEFAHTSVFVVLEWLWHHQARFLPSLGIDLEAELDGIADGMCDNLGKKCDRRFMRYFIKIHNLFPEIVRMSCTILMSWDKANKDRSNDIDAKTKQRILGNNPVKYGQDTIQLRLLDFGPVPFSDLQLLVIRHFDNFVDHDKHHTFGSLGFPGTAFVITSWNKHIAQSQKVFFTSIKASSSESLSGTSDHNNNTDKLSLPSNPRDPLGSLFKLDPKYETIGDMLNDRFKTAGTEYIQSILDKFRHDSTNLLSTYNTDRINMYKEYGIPTSSSLYSTTYDMPTPFPARSSSSSSSPLPSSLSSYRQQQYNQYTNTTHGQQQHHTVYDNSPLSSLDSTLYPRNTQPITIETLHGERPGSFEGPAEVFVIRALIQRCSTLDDIKHMISQLHPTWAIFLGFGTSFTAPDLWVAVDENHEPEYRTPALLSTYEGDTPHFYNDKTTPLITSNIQLDHVILVDRRPQPSKNSVTAAALEALHGDYTIEWIISSLINYVSSGDVHAVGYDFNTHNIYISIGIVDLKTWQFLPGQKAYERPFLVFDWDVLFNEKLPIE